MKIKKKFFKASKQNGMTLIELMSVIVIIGVLVGIVASNFINPTKNRALEASLKSNIRVIQVMLETYRVDNLSYPDSVTELEIEASKKNYSKKANNPYTKQNGPVSVWGVDYLDPADPSFPAQKMLYEGRVAYQKVNTTKYYLMGYGKDGSLILDKNTIYLITNGG